jgi:hypothetical protein
MPEPKEPVSKKEEKAKEGKAPNAAVKFIDKIKNNPKMRDMTDEEMTSYLDWEDNRIKTISN